MKGKDVSGEEEMRDNKISSKFVATFEHGFFTVVNAIVHTTVNILTLWF